MAEPKDQFAAPVMRKGVRYEILFVGHTEPHTFTVWEDADTITRADDRTSIVYANGVTVAFFHAHIMLSKATPFEKEVKPSKPRTPTPGIAWADAPRVSAAAEDPEG